MRIFYYFGLTLLLTACQGGSTVRDPLGGSYVDLTGATLELHAPLPIGAGRARVFVQHGMVVQGIDHYRPYCAFEIRSVDHVGAVIEPDRFRITQVNDSLQQVVAAPSAGLQRVSAIAWLGRSDSSSYYLGYHFTLHSGQQPQVMRISCYGVYAQPYELQAPDLSQIRALLGNIATIVR